jgi:adenylate cyclase class IV
VDFLKRFGWFLEIEGEPRSIRAIEKKLGLGDGDREERSYLQMLFQWKH